MPHAASLLSTSRVYAPELRPPLKKRAIFALVGAGLIDTIFHICFARMIVDLTVQTVEGMIGHASFGAI